MTLTWFAEAEQGLVSWKTCMGPIVLQALRGG